MPEFPFRYDPAHTALVVVDVQNDFCHPEGSLAMVGNDISGAEAMAPRLVKLIDDARGAGLPVIFVQTTHDETNDTSAWLDRTSAEPGTVPQGIICRTGTWGAEFYAVAPQTGDIVVIKHRFSAFVGTDLEIVLKTLGIRSLLFTGVATEVCVESSLRDGLATEYFVSLAEDCAASYEPAAHDAAVRGIRRSFGTVVTSGELATVWEGAAR